MQYRCQLRGHSAYSLERQGASGTNYAMALDDQDILQVLPLRGDKFEAAVRSIST